jgi:hypothetical protein
MKLSKITTFFGALLICAVSAFSQQQKAKYSPEQVADIVTKKMDEFILLKDGLFERVYDANRSTAQKNYDVRTDSQLTSARKNELIHENNENRKQYLQEVLSPEQFKKFLEFEQTMTTKKNKQQATNLKSTANKNQADQPNPEFGEL